MIVFWVGCDKSVPPLLYLFLYYSIFFYLLQDERENFTILAKALIFDAEYAIMSCIDLRKRNLIL